VNDFSDDIRQVGNAWLAYENGGVGRPIFSVFRNLNDEQVKEYYEIYKSINLEPVPAGLKERVKRLEVDLIYKNGQPNPKSFKSGDIIGLYYKDSDYHVTAFKDSATSRKWYPNGNMGANLQRKRIGHTFNTHVGVVGTIKDGVPLIFHNIHGNLISDPPQNLKIVWVKRPSGAALINSVRGIPDRISSEVSDRRSK